MKNIKQKIIITILSLTSIVGVGLSAFPKQKNDQIEEINKYEQSSYSSSLETTNSQYSSNENLIFDTPTLNAQATNITNNSFDLEYEIIENKEHDLYKIGLQIFETPLNKGVNNQYEYIFDENTEIDKQLYYSGKFEIKNLESNKEYNYKLTLIYDTNKVVEKEGSVQTLLEVIIGEVTFVTFENLENIIEPNGSYGFAFEFYSNIDTLEEFDVYKPKILMDGLELENITFKWNHCSVEPDLDGMYLTRLTVSGLEPTKIYQNLEFKFGDKTSKILGTDGKDLAPFKYGKFLEKYTSANFIEFTEYNEQNDSYGFQFDIESNLLLNENSNLTLSSNGNLIEEAKIEFVSNSTKTNYSIWEVSGLKKDILYENLIININDSNNEGNLDLLDSEGNQVKIINGEFEGIDNVVFEEFIEETSIINGSYGFIFSINSNIVFNEDTEIKIISNDSEILETEVKQIPIPQDIYSEHTKTFWEVTGLKKGVTYSNLMIQVNDYKSLIINSEGTPIDNIINGEFEEVNNIVFKEFTKTLEDGSYGFTFTMNSNIKFEDNSTIVELKSNGNQISGTNVIQQKTSKSLGKNTRDTIWEVTGLQSGIVYSNLEIVVGNNTNEIVDSNGNEIKDIVNAGFVEEIKEPLLNDVEVAFWIFVLITFVVSLVLMIWNRNK